MKTLFFAVCALAGVPLSAAEPQNLVINGDFETGKSPAFHSTPPWYNRGAGLNQGANARSDKNVLTTGQFSAIVTDRYDPSKPAFGNLAHSQATDYIIRAGDSFNLSYDWHPADVYWQKGRDTVRFVLYATRDDRLGGPVVWSSVLTSDFFNSKEGDVKRVLQATDPVTPAAVGRKLMIVFHGLDTVDGVAGSIHFARVDNILVTAERAPSPTKK